MVIACLPLAVSFSVQQIVVATYDLVIINLGNGPIIRDVIIRTDFDAKTPRTRNIPPKKLQNLFGSALVVGQGKSDKPPNSFLSASDHITVLGKTHHFNAHSCTVRIKGRCMYVYT